jgi:hypothetical protein
VAKSVVAMAICGIRQVASRLVADAVWLSVRKESRRVWRVLERVDTPELGTRSEGMSLRARDVCGFLRRGGSITPDEELSNGPVAFVGENHGPSSWIDIRRRLRDGVRRTVCTGEGGCFVTSWTCFCTCSFSSEIWRVISSAIHRAERSSSERIFFSRLDTNSCPISCTLDSIEEYR